MRKCIIGIVLLTALIVLTTAIAVSGETTSLKWKSFNEGLTEARKSNKKILVKVYTDWCGWCKRMDREVYTDKEVIAYLTKRYVVVKLNAESDAAITYHNRTLSQRELARAFGIQGYPSTIFMKPDSEAITLLPGYHPVEQFMDVLRFIGEDLYLRMTWEEYRSTTE